MSEGDLQVDVLMDAGVLISDDSATMSQQTFDALNSSSFIAMYRMKGQCCWKHWDDLTKQWVFCWRHFQNGGYQRLVRPIVIFDWQELMGVTKQPSINGARIVDGSITAAKILNHGLP